MDVRFEVLRIDGVWTLTLGPQLVQFSNENDAVRAGVVAARRHRADGLGEASVHAWRLGKEETVFDTRLDRDTGGLRAPE